MIPRIRFAHLPTPIEPLPRLSAILNGPHLLVKRDDQTGLAFGGNKTRKLEFLVAEAQAQGADTLLSAGALQSNHCRQTAAAAAKFGFNCILVLVGQPPVQASANLLLDQLFGAEIVWAEKSRREAVLQETFEKTSAQGNEPYLVPYGGSSPTGALGYVFAMEEFVGQKVKADWIVFASSSGGTQAGLVLGTRVFGYEGKVLGISIDEPQRILQEHVAKLASETSERLGPRIEFASDEVLVNDEYAAPGYGVLTGAEREAISLFAKYEGLLLDPVYTGRAAAGLIDLVREGFFKKDETVLFWHTGGQPALFAEKYQPELS
ncbi:MAG: D-cysteine desulfhydrase family protein [Candidatus Atribacteria bacterium]|nr:D-cysteine desulfhydrase family protein [Candidatus Atribacteria bacterium]